MKCKHRQKVKINEDAKVEMIHLSFAKASNSVRRQPVN